MIPDVAAIGENIKSFKVEHIQIELQDLSEVDKIGFVVKDFLLKKLELSLYMTQMDDGLFKMLPNIIEMNKPKYLVMPLSVYQSVDYYSLLEIAKNNHVWICPELTLGNINDEDIATLIKKIEESPEKLFMLISLNLDLYQVPNLNKILKKYRTHIGTIHLNINDNFLIDNYLFKNLELLLNDLILLPYDQQPLVLYGKNEILNYAFNYIAQTQNYSF